VQRLAKAGAGIGINGTWTARATSPATRTCSSIVSNGSVIMREAPVT
jgi:hypothetical protein